jgi:hypothetical protein
MLGIPKNMREDDDVVDIYATPLDQTIDRIGMGYYQWSLLGLCGFGTISLCNVESNTRCLLFSRMADRQRTSIPPTRWIAFP